MKDEQLLRWREVRDRTGLKKSNMYYQINRGTFPKQIKLSKYIAVWLGSEIESWITQRRELSRTQENTGVMRVKQVCDRVEMKRGNIYHFIKQGTFPKPIRLSPGTVGWLESDIEQWIAQHGESRRRKAELIRSKERLKTHIAEQFACLMQKFDWTSDSDDMCIGEVNAVKAKILEIHTNIFNLIDKTTLL